MFEHRSAPLLPAKQFFWRTLRFAFFSLLLLSVSLLLGMWGYRAYAGISWVDAFYNASMILTGMGPGLNIDALAPERQSPVKIFAGLYAIYSGVVFLGASGLILSPILHRFFHKLHLDVEGN